MTGHKHVRDLQSMYEFFLRTAWHVLKDKGRIVMLVLRGLQLTRIICKLSGKYRLLNVNVVRTTNNLPSIVVVEKLAADEVRDSVKRQFHVNSGSTSEGCDEVEAGVLGEGLLTKTQYEDGRPPSYHKSRVTTLSWRTCHDKFLGRNGLFEQLGIKKK